MKSSYLILFIVFVLAGCSENERFVPQDRSEFTEIEESEVFHIPISGELSRREAEISGLAWYEDNLIILPQFPYLFGDGLYGKIYYIPKEKLKRKILSGSELPITPLAITIDAAGLEKFNWWGSGSSIGW